MTALAQPAWTVTCTPDQFNTLKRQPRFATLVALARCANQVRFAAFSLDTLEATDTPLGARQQTSAMMAVCGALYDGIRLGQVHVNKHFHQHALFPRFAALWKGENAEFFQEHLKPVRHKAVAHFDPDEIGRLLGDLEIADSCVFALGGSNQSKDLHFRLADAVAIMSFVGPVASYTELAEKHRALVGQLGRYSGEFIHAADALIGSVLGEYGFVTSDE